MCIFLATARLTQLYAELFHGLGVPGVLEIHSRKSQPQRTRVAEQFREGRSGLGLDTLTLTLALALPLPLALALGSRLLLFTSDVSARGMDYPDVTAVVQVGLPSDRAQYVHRLGRTARAGKAGGGHLLLADFETFFLSSLRDLPLQTRPPLAAAEVAALQPVLRQGFGALGTVTLGTSYQAPSTRLAPASAPA